MVVVAVMFDKWEETMMMILPVCVCCVSCTWSASSFVCRSAEGLGILDF